jgi:hypothetical protein
MRHKRRWQGPQTIKIVSGPTFQGENGPSAERIGWIGQSSGDEGDGNSGASVGVIGAPHKLWTRRLAYQSKIKGIITIDMNGLLFNRQR